MSHATTPSPAARGHTADAPMILVAHENRTSDMVGVRLLVASLARHSPDQPVQIFVPPALADDVQASIQRIHPQATAVPFVTDIGWGCKPTVLLQVLDAAPTPDTRVMWIDSDIIVRDSIQRLAAVPVETLIIAEETNPHDNPRLPERHKALGFEPGPPRVTTLSSCIVGVTARHRALLQAWEAGVQTDLFADMQKLPWSQRLLPGDQEVLEAVVCSAPFADTPLRVLRNHNEMVQATYTPDPPMDGHKPGQTPPLFVHATGNLKPWRTVDSRLTKEMFPYFEHAQPYLDQLEPGEADAFNPRCTPAIWWKRLLGPAAAFKSYVTLRRLQRRLGR